MTLQADVFHLGIHSYLLVGAKSKQVEWQSVVTEICFRGKRLLPINDLTCKLYDKKTKQLTTEVIFFKYF